MVLSRPRQDLRRHVDRRPAYGESSLSGLEHLSVPEVDELDVALAICAGVSRHHHILRLEVTVDDTRLMQVL